MNVSKTPAQRGAQSKSRKAGRGKTTPASTPGSFKAYAHGTPEIDLGAGPTSDFTQDFDLDDLTVDDPFSAPLSHVQEARVQTLQASLLVLQPNDTVTFPARDGEWRITFTDHAPEASAKSGIVEEGQYSALRYDADGHQTPDISLTAFDRHAGRHEAAHHAADFLIRCERAEQEKAATALRQADRDTEANSVASRLDPSVIASLSALRGRVA
jgi:hypothetical protein